MSSQRHGPKRGRGGRMTAGQRPVTEAQRIDINVQLDEFQRSDATEYCFPLGLSNHDRAVVHDTCRRLGFKSKSHGKGDNRQVSISKVVTKTRKTKQLAPLTISPRSLEDLRSYASRFPPSALEAAALSSKSEETLQAMAERLDAEEGLCSAEEQALGAEGRASSRPEPRGGGAADMSAEEVARAREDLARATSRGPAAALAAQRRALPIHAHREAILEAVAAHRVVLVAGETGCGKTTQVPQYLAEAAWAAGRGARVLCTQPRRVAAVTVAQRVAAERGEEVGGSVGYAIRLESRGGPRTSMVFQTCGVLVKQLAERGSAALRGVTHVLVDEVHERDRLADVLLVFLKQALAEEPGFRLVLMSATLESDRLAEYFGGCPLLRVPGLVHPVADYFLEDVLQAVRYEVPEAVLRAAEALDGRAGGGGDDAASDAVAGPALAGALQAAFMQPSDVAFARLAALVGVGEGEGTEGGEGAEEERAAVRSLAEEQGAPCSAPEPVDARHPQTGATALMVAAARGRRELARRLLWRGADAGARAADGSSAAGWARAFGEDGLAAELEEAARAGGEARAVAAAALRLSHYQSSVDVDEVDVDLVVALVAALCEGGGSGGRGGLSSDHLAALDPRRSLSDPSHAVLVFLPGWEEIQRARERLEAPALARHRLSVLALHSQVSPAEQQRAFARPPPGVRKVVLSTNVAETSVTIDDVRVVVDAGRVREKGFDAYSNVATLHTAWINQASAKQRRGRAGRTAPGACFKLYSRARHAAMAPHAVPEMLRTGLEELVLQIKVLDRPARRVMAADFLARALDPPLPRAVAAALDGLADLGALDAGERLTTLGRHLAALPAPPAAGRLLLRGALLGSLEPALAVAAAAGQREPWALGAGRGARAAADEAKRRLAGRWGGRSDHLAAVEASAAWRAAQRGRAPLPPALQACLHPGAARALEGARRQLGEHLRRLGLREREPRVRLTQLERRVLGRNALAAGGYPNVARLEEQAEGGQGGIKATLRSGDRAAVHPSSTLAGGARGGAPAGALLVYDEVVRAGRLSLRGCSLAHPLPLALVAARLEVEPEGEGGGGDGASGRGAVVVAMDRWARYEAAGEVADLLRLLRLRLARAFAAFLRGRGRPETEAAVDAAAALLSQCAAGDWEGEARRPGAEARHPGAGARRPGAEARRPPPEPARAYRAVPLAAHRGAAHQQQQPQR